MQSNSSDTTSSIIGNDLGRRPTVLPPRESQIRLALSAGFILLVAFNLRPAITSLSPFLGELQEGMALDGPTLSVLTTLPVICLGLFGLAAAPAARRIGLTPVLVLSLLAIIVGIFIRNMGVVPLFVGTTIIGAAMCLLGVLSPVLIKRDFANNMGAMMGLYTMLVGLGAATSTVAAAPLMALFDGQWQVVLTLWAMPAALAAVLGLLLLNGSTVAAITPKQITTGITRHTLAWQVTGYFAMVAALAYAVMVWGPAMLFSRGLDAASAGLVLSLSYVSQMPTGLLGPVIAHRAKDQRWLVVSFVAMTLAGLLGLLFAPVWSLAFWSVMLGLGQGGAFGLALCLIVLRAGNPGVAARLSGLVQSVGYIVGGIAGPLAVGLIYDWSQSWGLVAILYFAVAALLLIFGLAAGRSRTIHLA